MKKIILTTGLVMMTVSFSFVRPTREQVRKEIHNSGVLFPHIVYQTAVIESSAGKTNNNMFGFKAGKKYRRFSSWQESIVAYKKWQDKWYSYHLLKYHKQNECDYYHFILAHGYVDGRPFSNAGKLYIKKLKTVK